MWRAFDIVLNLTVLAAILFGGVGLRPPFSLVAGLVVGLLVAILDALVRNLPAGR